MASTKHEPARSPEERENQMINLAIQAAEEQLQAGTASSQIITHYLRLASVREKLERSKLEHENELLKAKTEAVKATTMSEAEYAKVLQALRDYKGEDGEL